MVKESFEVLPLTLVAIDSLLSLMCMSTSTPLLLPFTLPPLPSPPLPSPALLLITPPTPPVLSSLHLSFFPLPLLPISSISSPFSFLHLVFLALFSVQQTEQTKCPRAPMFFGLSLLMTVALHLFASTTNEQASEVRNSTQKRP